MTPTVERIALRMQWLAYQASRPVGLGFLHFSTDKTEEDIKSSLRETEWQGARRARHSDYILGRMVKCAACFRGDELVIPTNHTVTGDYQSWAWKYPTYQALHAAALESLTETQA